MPLNNTLEIITVEYLALKKLMKKIAMKRSHFFAKELGLFLVFVKFKCYRAKEKVI
jgi:hypothetical protein